MNINRIKLFAVSAIILPLSAVAFFSVSANTNLEVTKSFDEIEDIYKAKCLLCHKANAEKAFNVDLKDEEMVQAILKGKKAEKPPHMPEFESKGITEEKAKLLVAYMNCYPLMRYREWFMIIC